MRLVFSLSFLFLFIIPTKAQQPSFLLQWQKSLGGSGSEFLNSFEPTIDGGYILGAFSGSNISGDKTENSRGSYDYWVVKLNRDKNIEWQKTIGGDRFDWLYSVQQTTDGGYILGGSSESNKSGEKTDSARGGEDYWVLKLNSTGNIEWQKTIGGSGYDRLSSIQQTSDGGYILGGTSESNISGDKSENSRGSRDYWVIKLNDTGDIQWQKTFGGAAEDQLYSLRQALDGGYILGGTSMSDTGGEKSENNRGYYEDYWVLKLDNSGAIQWQKTIGGLTNDYLYAVRQTAEGGYILGGYSLSDISGEKTEESRGLGDYWIVKLNSSGNIQWQRTFGGANWEQLKSLQQTSDHGYILGGSSWSDSSGEKSEKLRE